MFFTDENVVPNYKKGFIQLNGVNHQVNNEELIIMEEPSASKGTRKFLKAVLLPMLDSAYPPHIGNARRSEIMKQFVTSKIISKISDETTDNNESFLV